MTGGPGPLAARQISMPLGVVMERRAITSRWARFQWLPVAVLPGAGAVEGWRQLESGDERVRYHAATLTLTLHRKDTLAYKLNLSSTVPSIYVVLRPWEAPDAIAPVRPAIVTVSSAEAAGYAESALDAVEAVRMPAGLLHWAQAFVDRHHVDEPFRKRRRVPAGEQAGNGHG
jgi:hypothetical protein